MTAALSPAQQFILGSITRRLAEVDRPTVRKPLTKVLYPKLETPMAAEPIETTAEEEVDAATRTRSKMPPAIRVLWACCRELEALKPSERRRVIAWLHDDADTPDKPEEPDTWGT